MLLAARGGTSLELSGEELDGIFSEALSRALDQVSACRSVGGPVLVIPPDITRFYSRAGLLTDIAVRELGALDGSKKPDRLAAVMPALGTHMTMTEAELRRMFPKTPMNKFRIHDWRNDVTTLGRIEGNFIEKVTEGKVRYDWPVQVNKLLLNKDLSMILSIGQVVPHEVTGMANHAKNIFVGTGGKEAIDKSHFAGASYGMEKIMGKTETPVRALFDEASKRFGDLLPPVLYVLTVVDQNAVRGIYIGFGRECFEEAAALSRQVNVELLDEPIQKAVVYLEPEEFRTTWLGNKAVYRTRMAMADNGELLILAPGLERFGEDLEVDKLIRKYGYRPSKVILEKVEKEKEIADNLSAASHLIHGSSEGRFTVRYCPGPGVSRSEIESVGYEWGSLDEALARYDINKLRLGWNTIGASANSEGERIFFVPNPALGLWAEKKRFNGS